MKFGFDDNLGVPQNLDTSLQVELASYHDLGELLTDFANQKLSVIFIPAGTLPYISIPYEIIAQATFFTQTQLTSIFVVPQQNAAESIKSVPALQLGRVNKYCTTSFWAPLITLLPITEPGTHLNFHDTAGFQDMLFAVNDGRVEGAMVWDIILKQNPAAAVKTKSLFQQTHLPTPVIVINSAVSEPAKTALINKLLSFRSTDKTAFFSHFTLPNSVGLVDFQQKIQQAQAHFKY